jgi:hypothetical protein
MDLQRTRVLHNFITVICGCGSGHETMSRIADAKCLVQTAKKAKATSLSLWISLVSAIYRRTRIRWNVFIAVASQHLPVGLKNRYFLTNNGNHCLITITIT